MQRCVLSFQLFNKDVVSLGLAKCKCCFGVFNVSVYPCRDVCILSISSCIKCIYILVEQSDSGVYKRRLRLKSFVHNICACIF